MYEQISTWSEIFVEYWQIGEYPWEKELSVNKIAFEWNIRVAIYFIESAQFPREITRDNNCFYQLWAVYSIFFTYRCISADGFLISTLSPFL